VRQLVRALSDHIGAENVQPQNRKSKNDGLSYRDGNCRLYGVTVECVHGVYLHHWQVTNLHHGADGLTVREYLAECLGAENVAQRRLCEQLRRSGRVLDVDNRDAWVRDAIVDDRVDSDRHRVTRQNLTHTPPNTQLVPTYRLHIYHFLSSARSRAYATMSLSVCLSVRLSVTEVHWRIIANSGFKFRS